MPTNRELLKEFQGLILSAASTESLMQRMSDRLHEEKSRYNWVGFYLVDKSDAATLVVGPHTGSFTPQMRIPLDRGLCGAAATSGKTIVVDDVSKDPRYLAGSDLVKSEIVLPIFAGKKLMGELDVNSYFAGTFSSQEREFLEACVALVSKYFLEHAQ
jgi:L-methionine (R)-S-oxide reductase